MADTDRSGIDAFEAFRSYLEKGRASKKVARLLPVEKREQVMNGIARAAYVLAALLRRGTAGAGDWLAFTKHPGPPDDQKGEDEEETAPPPPDNIIGFPSQVMAPEKLGGDR